MRSNRTFASALAAGVSAAVLFGAVTVTSAAPAQKGKKAPASGKSKADIAAGSKVYMANGCTACHAIGDKGGKSGPALTKIGADKKWPPAKLTTIVRKGAPPKMPAYGPDKINDKELKSLVAYMQSLK